MINPLKYSAQIFFSLLILQVFSPPAKAASYSNDSTAFQQPKDTVPEPSIFRKIGRYMDSLMNRRYRDSVLQKIAKVDDTVIQEDNTMQKSEKIFARHRYF